MKTAILFRCHGSCARWVLGLWVVRSYICTLRWSICRSKMDELRKDYQTRIQEDVLSESRFSQNPGNKIRRYQRVFQVFARIFKAVLVPLKPVLVQCILAVSTPTIKHIFCDMECFFAVAGRSSGVFVGEEWQDTLQVCSFILHCLQSVETGFHFIYYYCYYYYYCHYFLFFFIICRSIWENIVNAVTD